jgi:hypothetical protein
MIVTLSVLAVLLLAFAFASILMTVLNRSTPATTPGDTRGTAMSTAAAGASSYVDGQRIRPSDRPVMVRGGVPRGDRWRPARITPLRR